MDSIYHLFIVFFLLWVTPAIKADQDKDQEHLIFGNVPYATFPCIEKECFKAFEGDLGETINLQAKRGADIPYDPENPANLDYLAEIEVRHTINYINVSIKTASPPIFSKLEDIHEQVSVSMSSGSGRRLPEVRPKTTTPNVCMCDYPAAVAESLKDMLLVTRKPRRNRTYRQYARDLVKFEDTPVTLSMLKDIPCCLIDVGYPENNLEVLYGEQYLSKLDENGATFSVEEQLTDISGEKIGEAFRMLLYLTKALFDTPIENGVRIVRSVLERVHKTNNYDKRMLLYRAYSQAENMAIFEAALLNGKWLYGFSLKNTKDRYTSYWRLDSVFH